MNRIDIQRLKESLKGRTEELARHLYPNGKKVGNHWKIGSIKGEPGDSFDVNLATGMFGDWADGGKMSSNPINLWMAARSVDFKTAIEELSRWTGVPTVATPEPVRAERREQQHPALKKPSADEMEAISSNRSIRTEALRIAVKRGLLHTATLNGQRAWVITDKPRNIYLARRIDGQPWEHLPSKPKAWLLRGSRASWPIGIVEAGDYPAIALCEGGPDFLAAFAHAWASEAEGLVAPVCMSSASVSIAEEALPRFSGKRVRVFIHEDPSGYAAAKRWAAQLSGIAGKVDGFEFSKLVKIDGSKVSDLNDLLLIDYDCWESNRSDIESIMDFATEGRN